MIEVTRLNGKKFTVNCELIKFLETTPDTLITLTTDEKIMVKETIEQVIHLTMNYRKKLFQEPVVTKSF